MQWLNGFKLGFDEFKVLNLNILCTFVSKYLLEVHFLGPNLEDTKLLC